MARPIVMAIAIALQTRRTPVLLWGPSGIGKTSLMTALGAAIGAHVVDPIYCSTREATDFSGLPMEVGGRVKFVPPQFAMDVYELAQTHKLILLPIEEVNRTSQSVQNASLGFILGRRIGELTLQENVVIISAANPPATHNNANPFDSALSNRFVHFIFEPDVEDWIEGTTYGWAPLTVPILPENWISFLPEASKPFNDFLRANDGAFIDEPKDFEAGMMGWASPRSWEFAKLLWAAALSVNASVGVLLHLCRAAVGEAASVAMWAYYTKKNLPDPESLLADPESFEVPSASHLIYQIQDSVFHAVRKEPTQSRFEAACRIAIKVFDAKHQDLAMAAAQQLAELGRAKHLSAPQDFVRFGTYRQSLG